MKKAIYNRKTKMLTFYEAKSGKQVTEKQRIYKCAKFTILIQKHLGLNQLLIIR